MTAAELAQRLGGKQVRVDRWKAKCPAHEDATPSLQITQAKNGNVLIKCWAGCETDDVVKALGVEWKDLCAEKPRRRNGKANGHPASALVASLDRPKVLITTEERAVADQALNALAREPDIYQRGGELVHVIDDGDATRIRPMTVATLRERMAATAVWLAPSADGNVRGAHPPEWAVRALHSRGEWPPLRRLVAVTRVPTMRPDGSLLDRAGYDPATGVLYAPRETFPDVQIYPAPDDVREAVMTLTDPFIDFPWREPSDCAAAVSAILSIVARAAIDGPVPLLGIRSTAPASGKGLVAASVSLGATGRPPKLVTPPTDDAEWRKTVMSLAREGATVVSLDDVPGPLGCAPLAAALTTTEITDRLLGSTAIVTAPMRAVWLATGCGMTYRSTMARRVLACDLDPRVEHPEDRSGWRYPALAEHVQREHPRLVHAALTILRAYHVAGRPRHPRPQLGSFTAWDALIRGACVWAGIGDPDGGRARLRDEGDDDRDSLRAALGAWREAFGERPLTLAEVCACAGERAALRAALEGIVARGQLTPRSLGYAVRKVRDRIAGGLTIAGSGMAEGERRWRVTVAIGGDQSHPVKVGGEASDGSKGTTIATASPPPSPPSLTDGNGGDSGDGGDLSGSVRKHASLKTHGEGPEHRHRSPPSQPDGPVIPEPQEELW